MFNITTRVSGSTDGGTQAVTGVEADGRLWRAFTLPVTPLDAHGVWITTRPLTRRPALSEGSGHPHIVL